MKTTILTIITLFSIVLTSYSQSTYKVIYEADKNGKTITGNLEELIHHVQEEGNPVRVGWSIPAMNPQTMERFDMWHWVDAGFLTILNGHLFAQIQGIFQQGPGLQDPPAVYLVTDQADSWVAIVGTTGELRQKFTENDTLIEAYKNSGMSEDEIKKELKKMEKMNVRTRWAIMIN